MGPNRGTICGYLTKTLTSFSLGTNLRHAARSAKHTWNFGVWETALIWGVPFMRVCQLGLPSPSSWSTIILLFELWSVEAGTIAVCMCQFGVC